MNATIRLKIVRFHQAARARVARALAVAFGIAVAALPLPAHAQFTWTGDGANTSWSTNDNWGIGITPPADSFNSAFVFGGTTGTNSFNDRTGGTILNLTFNAGSGPFTLSGNSVAIGGSPTWTNNSSNTQTVALPLTMTSNRTLTKAGTGELDLSGNVSLTGTSTDGGNNFTSNTGMFRISGNVALPTSGTGASGLFGRFVVRGAGSGVVSGVISGGVAGVTTVVRSSVGSGEWVLSGNNTYLGNTLINGGTLTLSGASTISGTTTLNAARLNINNGGSGGTSSALGTSRLVINAGASLGNTSGTAVTLSTNNEQTWNSNFSFAGPSNLDLGTGAVTLTASPTVSVNTANLTVGGPISGSFGLTKSGSGTLTLSGSNAYTGTTSIDAGTLALTGSAGSIADSPMIRVGSAGSSGAVLDLTSKTGTVAFTSSQTVGGIGTIKLGAGATAQFAGILAPGNSAGVLTFDGGTALLSGTTQIEIFGGNRGTGYDAVDLINSAAIDYGNGVLTLDFGSWLADQQSYQLFGDGSATLLGDFSALSIVGTNYSGLTFTGSSGVWTSQGTSPSGQTLTFTTSTGTLVIVPEPATVTLAGLGIAAAAYALRRTLEARSTSGGSRAKKA